jgi:hypothetical protein
MLKYHVIFSAHPDMTNSRSVYVRAFTEQQACDKVVAEIRRITRTTKDIHVIAVLV